MKRSRRRIFRSAYCRTASGTSRFLPLTIVLTVDLQGGGRPATLGAARATGRRGPSISLALQLPGGHHASRATVHAATPAAPSARSACAHATSVAPVVATSSTSTIQRPATAGRWIVDPERVRHVLGAPLPPELELRYGRALPNQRDDHRDRQTGRRRVGKQDRLVVAAA